MRMYPAAKKTKSKAHFSQNYLSSNQKCVRNRIIKLFESTAASDHTPTSTPILGSEISEMFNAGVGTGGGADFSSLAIWRGGIWLQKDKELFLEHELLLA